MLTNLIEDASSAGLRVKTGVEAEFFLLNADGTEISDEHDTAAKPSTTSRQLCGVTM